MFRNIVMNPKGWCSNSRRHRNMAVSDYPHHYYCKPLITRRSLKCAGNSPVHQTSQYKCLTKISMGQDRTWRVHEQYFNWEFFNNSEADDHFFVVDRDGMWLKFSCFSVRDVTDDSSFFHIVLMINIATLIVLKYLVASHPWNFFQDVGLKRICFTITWWKLQTRYFLVRHRCDMKMLE